MIVNYRQNGYNNEDNEVVFACGLLNNCHHEPKLSNILKLLRELKMAGRRQFQKYLIFYALSKQDDAV